MTRFLYKLFPYISANYKTINKMMEKKSKKLVVINNIFVNSHQNKELKIRLYNYGI